jgi:hypothetical protein
VEPQMRHRKFTILGIALALFYWFAESVIHRYVYADEFFEIVPSDVNEFWMRVLIILLIFGFGIFADNRAWRIRKTEREKYEVYLATVQSTQHILNNLLNQLQLMFFELDENRELAGDTRKLLKKSMKEGKAQVERLSSVTEISSESIQDSVKPK